MDTHLSNGQKHHIVDGDSEENAPYETNLDLQNNEKWTMSKWRKQSTLEEDFTAIPISEYEMPGLISRHLDCEYNK